MRTMHTACAAVDGDANACSVRLHDRVMGLDPTQRPSGQNMHDSPSNTPDSQSTRGLLARHHAGDPRALGELLSRELPAIREMVRRRLTAELRRRMDTNDAVQEVCLHVLRKGPGFLVNDSACFRALMSRIVENFMVSSFRHYGSALGKERNRSPETLLELDAPSPTTAPPEKAARVEAAEALRVALLLLDPLDAEIMRLRDEEDLPFADVGRRVQKTEDAARRRYDRALRKLEHLVLRLRNGQLHKALEELDREAERA